MEFNMPTTIDEMYQVLNDLFYYYRIRREGYEEVMLQPLELERLSYTPPTDEQLIDDAREILAGEHEREISEYKLNLTNKIIELQEKINLLEVNAQAEISALNNLFFQSVEKLEKQAIKAGLINSNVVVLQSAKLESDKNLKIADITANKNKLIMTYSAEKQALENKLESADEYFKNTHEKDVDKKVLELKKEREQLTMEVFKYNNGLDEKEQRYENSIKQNQMSLKIRYLEVTTGEFTKDQLIDMGYYQDVVDCVTGYFNTLDASEAYYKFKEQSRLVIYLDDYYDNVLYLYRSAAEL